MFNLTKSETLSGVEYWMSEIERCAPERTTIVLVGNQCDNEMDRKISHSEASVLKSL